MKLVIEIPEDEYELVRHGNKSYMTELVLMNAVAEGTSLENILDKTFDKLDKTIVDALDNSENQVECQTLRWVLDVISEVTKYGNSN